MTRSITLELRQDNGTLKPLARSFKTYREAVLLGQELVGYGRFHVATNFVPTREEQLLQRKKSDEFWDTL